MSEQDAIRAAKKAAIEALVKDAGREVAYIKATYPGPVGAFMALRVIACAEQMAHTIAAHSPVSEGEAVATIAPCVAKA